MVGGEAGRDGKVRARTPIGRLATMDEIVGAAVFLLENTAVNGVDLIVERRLALPPARPEAAAYHPAHGLPRPARPMTTRVHLPGLSDVVRARATGMTRARPH